VAFLGVVRLVVVDVRARRSVAAGTRRDLRAVVDLVERLAVAARRRRREPDEVLVAAGEADVEAIAADDREELPAPRAAPLPAARGFSGRKRGRHDARSVDAAASARATFYAVCGA
jgi:hypothetical protein